MKEVALKIKGTQILDNEKDTIEIMTRGKFYKKGDSQYLVYDESELSGMEGSTTTLKIQQNKVEMKRFGAYKSNLIFEKDKKHISLYQTAYGNMEMEVITNHIEVDINDAGKGTIDADYKLYIADMTESKNKLHIEIL